MLLAFSLLLQSLRAQGIKHVMAVDTIANRLELARACGAKVISQNNPISGGLSEQEFFAAINKRAVELRNEFAASSAEIPANIKARVQDFGFSKVIEVVGFAEPVALARACLAKGGTMEAREITLRRVLEQQGFKHSDQTTRPASDTNKLFARAEAAGYPEILVRRKEQGFQAWVDRPERAHGGEGETALLALENAILEAERDAEFKQ